VTMKKLADSVKGNSKADGERRKFLARVDANIASSINAAGFSDEALNRPPSLKFVLTTVSILSETLVDAFAKRDKHLKELEARLKECADRVAAVELSGLKYAGAWQKANGYSRGSVVSYGGSAWCCTKDHEQPEQPGAGLAWQLLVKRGSDGKDAAR
jgi:hypothetical protein